MHTLSVVQHVLTAAVGKRYRQWFGRRRAPGEHQETVGSRNADKFMMAADATVRAAQSTHVQRF
eukprot:892122-Prymnesium_polylepis.1